MPSYANAKQQHFVRRYELNIRKEPRRTSEEKIFVCIKEKNKTKRTRPIRRERYGVMSCQCVPPLIFFSSSVDKSPIHHAVGSVHTILKNLNLKTVQKVFFFALMGGNGTSPFSILRDPVSSYRRKRIRQKREPSQKSKNIYNVYT